MANARAGAGRTPELNDTLRRHAPAWVPGFLARASLGLASVVVVSVDPAGEGGVALLSPVEASAWLKARGDNRGSAKLAGSVAPGSVWSVGVHPGGVEVSALVMAPFLAGG